MQRKFWLKRSGLAAFCVCLLLANAVIAGGQSAAPLSQRRINEIGAALFTASRILIEDTNLRRPNESLPDYGKRLVETLPGETAAQHDKRLTAYIAALQKAADATAILRQAPAIHDKSPENSKAWNMAVKACRTLPRRLQRLNAVMQARKPSLHTEFVATLYVLLAARDALRDARP